MTETQIEEARALSREGWTQRMLAERYQVSRTTIGKSLMDDPTRFRGKQRSRLRETWAAVDQAAEALGVSEAAVILMCERGELLGAVRLGRATWLVPRSVLANMRRVRG